MGGLELTDLGQFLQNSHIEIIMFKNMYMVAWKQYLTSIILSRKKKHETFHGLACHENVSIAIWQLFAYGSSSHTSPVLYVELDHSLNCLL